MTSVSCFGGGLSPLVLIDNCAAHDKAALSRVSMENNATVAILPPQTTHIIQPLDNAPFACFKREFRAQYARSWEDDHMRGKALHVYMEHCIREAAQKTLTPDVIRAGWR